MFSTARSCSCISLFCISVSARFSPSADSAAESAAVPVFSDTPSPPCASPVLSPVPSGVESSVWGDSSVDDCSPASVELSDWDWCSPEPLSNIPVCKCSSVAVCPIAGAAGLVDPAGEPVVPAVCACTLTNAHTNKNKSGKYLNRRLMVVSFGVNIFIGKIGAEP